MQINKYHIIFVIVIVALFINNLYNEDSLYKNIENAEELKDYNSLEDKLSYITGKIECNSLVSDNEYVNNFKGIVILKKTVQIYETHKIKQSDTFMDRKEKRWSSYYLTQEKITPKSNKKSEDIGVFYFYPSSCKINDIEIPINKFVANSYSTIQFPNSQIDNKENTSYFYFGNKDVNNPEIGDIRIRYQVYQVGEETTILLNNNKNLRFENMPQINSIYTDNILKTIYKGTKEELLIDLKHKRKFMKFLINTILIIIFFGNLLVYLGSLFYKKLLEARKNDFKTFY
ncbi:hypothetical protein H0A43_06495 [Arcobacter lanthieri]|uniref:TMEM43 family protein n=1 Tax=Aliarcobacter lanthieri TaxID=1355374 RepID=UPI0019236BDA|nr:TMEM43 family protein [Aliarcobacter lanthieri]MBL3520118.1 hypothetical protein [Aliarcobacter lanthieri]